VTLRSTFRLGRQPVDPHMEVLLRDSWKHVAFRALALGLSNREVLHVTLKSTFRLGRCPFESLTGRSQYVTP
jgi:hypothetical protein